MVVYSCVAQYNRNTTVLLATTRFQNNSDTTFNETPTYACDRLRADYPKSGPCARQRMYARSVLSEQ